MSSPNSTLEGMNGAAFHHKPDGWIKPSKNYEVPLTSLNDPANRRIRAITIGAGFAGIMMAYKIDQFCENVEHVVYEMNPELGGTWLENRYPGLVFILSICEVIADKT
jgi:hypothetical protein